MEFRNAECRYENASHAECSYRSMRLSVHAMKRAILAALALSLLIAACSDSADPLVGIRASTDMAVGDNRLVFAVSELDGTRRGSPDEMVTVVASPLDEPDRSLEAVGEFTWIAQDLTGLYIAHVPFDTAGLWQIDFTISTGEETDSFLVDIQSEPLGIAVGEVAPIVATPTTDDMTLADLTTDPNPRASMYQLSLDEALTNGRSTVVVFATPAFCTSATCGPLLDQVKGIVDRAPDADFIHIEVYQGFDDPSFNLSSPEYLSPAVVEFGLVTEPWVFVMDESGVVVARLDGILGVGELEGILGVEAAGE